MAVLPKGFRKKINFIEKAKGPERRQGYLDNIDKKGTYLPKGVDFEDIDRSFFDFVDDDLELVLNGDTVPVIVLTITKWAEFSKTWSFSDKYKNIKMPFITIIRQPNPQIGTNQAGNWNIPGNKLYTYIKVPTSEGGRRGIDTYKIPQPTSVDLIYDVRLFCNRMKDLNEFNKIIQKTFNSRQFYISIKGHPMPIHLEKIGDESQKNIDERRFYVQHYEMKVLGYILDENDFEVIPSINRAKINFKEVIGDRTDKQYVFNKEVSKNTFQYKINFEPNSLLTFDFDSDIDLKFTTIQNIMNVTNIIIEVNDVEEFNGLIINEPIYVNNGDKVTIKITTNDISSDSLFIINGKLRDE